MHFDYETYFAHYKVNEALTPADAWRIFYREILRMHSPTVVHIVDGNLLDENRAWQERERRCRHFIESGLPVPPHNNIGDTIGRLYAAHAVHTGEFLQPHNIEGTGFAYLTRALLIRFCGLTSEKVRISPLWTTLPGYTHLAGVPKIQPDVAVLRTLNGREDTYGVISLKWTIRHDRLKNTITEAHELMNRKRGGRPTYVAFVTNEFVLGRLRSAANSPEINCVYHVCLTGLEATFEGEEGILREIAQLRADGVLKDVSALFANFG